MKLTLESLYRDHDNFRRILYLLEQLLIDICRGSSRDYPLIQHILAYIQDYPERVHHPREDAILMFIVDNGLSEGKFRGDINILMRDHSEIEGMTRDTMHAFERMRINGHPDIPDIGDRLSKLIQRQRAHLLFEEVNIYPHIADHLDDVDWETISIVTEHDDPIFGDRVSKEYEQIFKAL
jgi:hemerythrin-like domain-containing protein